MNDTRARIKRLLTFLYGEEEAERARPGLEALMDSYRGKIPAPSRRAYLPDERDSILITYGDQFRAPGEHPLRTLRGFLDTHLEGCVSGVHILPCFPYTSDDGFSVVDYRRVDPELGDWDDIAALGERYRLMLDFVANHVSRRSDWFASFLRGEHPYTDYFITPPEDADLSRAVRPRTLPLLTKVETVGGERSVWTTFSADQIDLNYAAPRVLLEMTDILLHYAFRGAEIIRLDAIAYLWKTPGTSCIHLPKTHAVVRFWRAVLDDVAPHVLLITETNVPHAENVGYFGEAREDGRGTDEAQMVYNFSLAPLTLHALSTGDATVLSKWASELTPPARGATFFNFIASHDGIGVTPARDILSDEQVRTLAERALAHGGHVSYKTNADGSISPYELNITLYDFLNDPAKPEPETDTARFIASQAILLSLAGVPGIYVHSLFGSRNCHECFAETGRARSLNRKKFDRSALEEAIVDPAERPGRIFNEMRRLLRVRREEQAFHPEGEQKVLDIGEGLFALLRTPPDGGRPVLCLQNISSSPQRVTVGADHLPGLGGRRRDLLTDAEYRTERGVAEVVLKPYGTCWLTR